MEAEFHKSFRNELGHDVEIGVTLTSETSALIQIAGPDSMTENYITAMEARELMAALGEVFFDEDELARLRRFKAYVHQRLDEAGVTKQPEGPHSAQGCRIGDRLDLALEARARLEQLGLWLGVIRANHLLAAGMIQGLAETFQRPDLVEHAERMCANIEAMDAELARANDNAGV